MFALSLLIPALGSLPPQGLVMTLTSNLEVFLNGFWSNRRSADIPPSESLLVLCLKDGGGDMENTRNYVIKIFLLEQLSIGCVRHFLITQSLIFI